MANKTNDAQRKARYVARRLAAGEVPLNTFLRKDLYERIVRQRDDLNRQRKREFKLDRATPVGLGEALAILMDATPQLSEATDDTVVLIRISQRARLCLEERLAQLKHDWRLRDEWAVETMDLGSALECLLFVDHVSDDEWGFDRLPAQGWS